MSESEIIYLRYGTFGDMLKVIIYSAQSMLGVTPMLYYLHNRNRHILFIQTGTVGGTTIHYILHDQSPVKNLIQLKRLTGDYSYVDAIGTDAQSLYVPIVRLESTNLEFPA